METQDNLSEWLRRQTRNLLGFARAGSNPAVVEFFKYPFYLFCKEKMKEEEGIPIIFNFS